MDKFKKWILIDYDERLSNLYIPLIKTLNVGIIFNNFLTLEIDDDNIKTLENVQENVDNYEELGRIKELISENKIFDGRKNDIN